MTAGRTQNWLKMLIDSDIIWVRFLLYRVPGKEKKKGKTSESLPFYHQTINLKLKVVHKN